MSATSALFADYHWQMACEMPIIAAKCIESAWETANAAIEGRVAWKWVYSPISIIDCLHP